MIITIRNKLFSLKFYSIILAIKSSVNPADKINFDYLDGSNFKEIHRSGIKDRRNTLSVYVLLGYGWRIIFIKKQCPARALQMPYRIRSEKMKKTYR